MCISFNFNFTFTFLLYTVKKRKQASIKISREYYASKLVNFDFHNHMKVLWQTKAFWLYRPINSSCLNAQEDCA